MENNQKLIKVIMEQGKVYSFLVNYFVNYLEDWYFQQNILHQGNNEKQIIAEYLAALVPGVANKEALMKRIDELAAANFTG